MRIAYHFSIHQLLTVLGVHCCKECVQFVSNDILSVYKKNNSKWRHFVIKYIS